MTDAINFKPSQSRSGSKRQSLAGDVSDHSLAAKLARLGPDEPKALREALHAAPSHAVRGPWRTARAGEGKG